MHLRFIWSLLNLNPLRFTRFTRGWGESWCSQLGPVFSESEKWKWKSHLTLSMGFSRPEYWSGQPLSPPGDLPDPGIKLGSPGLEADSLPAELWGKPQYSVVLSILNLRGHDPRDMLDFLRNISVSFLFYLQVSALSLSCNHSHQYLGDDERL